MFKCLNKTAPEQFHNWFKLTREIHEHHTRSNFNVNDGTIISNLFTPSVRTTNYGLKQLKVNGTRIWNDLPAHLKNVTSLNVFLKNLKLYYISGYVFFFKSIKKIIIIIIVIIIFIIIIFIISSIIILIIIIFSIAPFFS